MNDKCHNYNTAVESDTVNYVFIHLQGLGSSQLADHVVNEINQGPWYVKDFVVLRTAVMCLTTA